MHACSICHRACSCSGDSDTGFVSLHEPDGCTCCIGVCEHGMPADEFCSACEGDEAVIESPAPGPQLNGGW